MRAEVQAKVKDVREAADDNLAKAAARSGQARSKVEELKASLLKHWQEADRSLCCAALCCAVLCCAALRCAVLCCAALCCAMLCCAVPCCAVPVDW